MRPMKARKYGVECCTKRESHKLHAEFWYAHVWMGFCYLFFFFFVFAWLRRLVARMCGRPTTYTVTGIGLHIFLFFFVLFGRVVRKCCWLQRDRRMRSRHVLVCVWNSLRGKELSLANSFIHVWWSALLVRHWHITRYPCVNWTSHNYYRNFNWTYISRWTEAVFCEPATHCPLQ